jgi:hypothetical protein
MVRADEREEQSMEKPVWDLTIVVAATSAEASALLETLTEVACRETGGVGEGDDHVCGGFICASLGPISQLEK